MKNDNDNKYWRPRRQQDHSLTTCQKFDFVLGLKLDPSVLRGFRTVYSQCYVSENFIAIQKDAYISWLVMVTV
jgi:hypothetical protein